MIPSRERVLSKARLIYENDHSKKHKRMISSRERALSKSRLIYENDHSKKCISNYMFLGVSFTTAQAYS
jgi:hypothetical protein